MPAATVPSGLKKEEVRGIETQDNCYLTSENILTLAESRKPSDIGETTKQ